MGRKRTTTLHLDEDLVRRCKELGINISGTVTKILETILTSPAIDEEEIRLEILLAERRKLEKREDELKSELNKVREHISYLDKRIEKQQVLVNEVRRSNEIAYLVRVLNRKIKECNFESSRILKEASDILEQLRKLQVNVDDVWLQRQIERVKRLSL